VIYTAVTAGEIPVTCTVAGLNSGSSIITVLPSTQAAGVSVTMNTPVFAPGMVYVSLAVVDSNSNRVLEYSGDVSAKIFNKNTDEIIFSSAVPVTNGAVSIPIYFKQPGVYTFETSGHGLAPAKRNYPVIINRARDNYIQSSSDYGNVQVSIASGTFDLDMIVEIMTGDKVKTRIIQAAGNTSGTLLEQTQSEIVTRDKNGSDTQTDLTGTGKYMVLNIPYPDVDNDGVVDGTDIKETTLKVWHLNNDAWEVLINVSVAGNTIDNVLSNRIGAVFTSFGINTSANTIAVPVTRSGTYAVMGVATDPVIYNPVVYPNPVIDNASICFEVGSQCDIVVDIYTLSGREVRSFNSAVTVPVAQGDKRTVSYTFDGCDDLNKELANGTYIYKITTQNNSVKNVKLNKFVKTK
jgi:hypothetical protein